MSHRPTRMYRARSTMMLAVLCWFARVGERFAAVWRRMRDRFARSRSRPAPVDSAPPTGEVGRTHVISTLRVTRVFVTRPTDHARHSS